MKEQERLDKVLNAAYTVAQDEVAALSGAALTLSEPILKIQSKEEAFDDLVLKQVLSKIDVRGDIEGEGCLVVGVKDAVRLGGILIMLPDGELDEFVANENYSEEIEDSYGEIANIIAGAYSKAFEDMYPKACRLIRKEQEVISPAKVEVDSDAPVANQSYYTATHKITISDNALGNLVLMLPAETFGLVQKEVEPVEEAPEEVAAQQQPDTSDQEENNEENQETAVDTGEPEPEENVPSVVAYNSKNLEKLNKIIEAAQSTVAEEVSGLIGAELVVNRQDGQFKIKEELLEELEGKQVAAKMDVRGDIEGQGALFVDLKGAIRLGGTLIMLPQTELEEAVGRAEYNEETEDSYGEIANIIAGSYSKIFEEMYPRNCRLIRKEQEVITPVKVDPESDHLFPPQTYYMVQAAFTLDGVEGGTLTMALPALTFGILDSDESASADEEITAGSITQKNNGETPSDEGAGVATEQTSAPQQPQKPAVDSEKEKEIVDKLLTACTATMKEEVGAMLGTEVILTPAENKLVTKEDLFFDEVSGKQVLAHMDIVGDTDDRGFFFVCLKDAIRIGGILIMLPPSELEVAITEEEYTEDIQDAYGEIANIIAGVYTGIFEEQYKKKLRFVRKELENVVPMKVDIGSDQPIPDQKYYIHVLKLTIGEKELGNIHMALPAELFQLDRLGEVSEVPAEDQADEMVSATEKSVKDNSVDSVAAATTSPSSDYDVVVIGNDEHEKSKIISVLKSKGMEPLELSFKDNIYNHVNNNVKAVFLVMQEVNELGFGVAIKISTACSCPLIAAGAGWTRTKVIKAVKYGVVDIVLTPATDDDISDKVESNLVKLAA